MARFEARSLKGIKFNHPDGFTKGSGFGVFDTQAGEFVSDAGVATGHPWDYARKAVVQSVVDQFNTQGPVGVLTYGVRHG